MHEVAYLLQIEGVEQVYVGDQLVLGPMEAMGQHQWDTAKPGEVGRLGRRVRHQVMDETTREFKRFTENEFG